MKKTTFLKTLFTLLLCGFFSMTYAGTIYLSSTGDDLNNGTSLATAVKTFSKAQDLASAGDTVMVSGMIEFAAEVALTKNLIVMGTSNTMDGFDGKNLTRLMNTSGFDFSVSNIKFTGGNGTGNGGALKITGGNVSFTFVLFEDNTTDVRGGAITIEPATALTLNFKNCVLKNNSSTTEAAAYFYTDSAGTANSITFTNCAIISNNAATTGAGGYVNNTTGSLQLFYINTTIAKNNSGGNSSAGLFVGNLQATSNLVLTNCTITENTCQTAATSGAGIRIATAVNTNGGKVKLYNTILENNYYPTTSTGTTTSGWTTDFVWQGDGFTPGTNLIIENSYIGRPMAASNVKWLVATNSFPTSKYNYVTAVSGNCTDSYLTKFAPFDATTNSYALTDDSGDLKFKGLTSHLTGLMPAVTTDQLGKTRPTPDCSIGAVEKNPVLGLKKLDKNNTVAVFRNASNQIVITDTETDAKASISVYNVLGQMVYKTQSTGVVTTIEKSFNSGLYLVSVSREGAAITKKVVLN